MSDPAPPRVVAGRYEIGDVIGQGGHGWVYRARDLQTGSPVAVKMLNDIAARDPEIIERLKREQQALAALAGTSAVGLVDMCQGPGGKLCLVMELLDGHDLESHIEEIERAGRRMSYEELLPVLAPVVETLERAHSSGILHRDLKPANVFMLNGGGVRLLDFGLARIRSAQPLTAAGMVMGSPSYIAPEVWKGSGDKLDQRCDVYAFGVLVFRALSGAPPFPGESLQEKYMGATSAPRPSLHAVRPDLPADIDGWVRQILAIDPNSRFHTVRAAWNALHDALQLPEPAEQGEPEPAKGPAAAARAAPRALKSAWRSAQDALKRIVDVIDPAATRDARLPEISQGMKTPAAAKAAGPTTPLAPPAAPLTQPSSEKSLVSEWLSGSDLQVEPPTAVPPGQPPKPLAPPPRAAASPPTPPPPPRPLPPVPRLQQRKPTPADPSAKTQIALDPPSPLSPAFRGAEPAQARLQAGVDDRKSFVSEFLSQSVLDAPPNAEDADDDVVSWLGGSANEKPAAERQAKVRPAPKPPSPRAAPKPPAPEKVAAPPEPPTKAEPEPVKVEPETAAPETAAQAEPETAAQAEPETAAEPARAQAAAPAPSRAQAKGKSPKKAKPKQQKKRGKSKKSVRKRKR